MSEQQPNNTITPERLEALHQRYPIFGGIALSDVSVTSWHYDLSGNKLQVTVQAGQEIIVEESRG